MGIAARHRADAGRSRRRIWAAIAGRAGCGPCRRCPDPRSPPPQEAIFLRYRRALDTWLSEELDPACRRSDHRIGKGARQP
ncbi:MAG: hypothetical protein U0528_09555 [Anaerolineae bacterium]